MGEVTGLKEKQNSELIATLNALVADAKSGVMIGIHAVVTLADGAAIQVIEGDVIEPAAVIGQLHVMAMQQAMIEAAENLEDDDE